MTCIFCDLKNNKNILEETENFYVKVGIGIVTAGHIMIIPKKHYKAFGEINSNTVDEYLALKEKVFNKISLLFSEPFLIEYGNFAQSVHHAHIHFIPKSNNIYTNVDLLNNMILKVREKLNFDLIKINSFDELQKFYNTYNEYIYFEDKNKHIIKVNNGLRKNINALSYRNFFKTIGVKSILDWSNMTEKEKQEDNIKISNTIKKYKKISII